MYNNSNNTKQTQESRKCMKYVVSVSVYSSSGHNLHLMYTYNIYHKLNLVDISTTV